MTDAESATLPAAVRSLSSSRRLVWLHLRECGPATPSELADALGYSDQCIINALRDLRNAGAATDTPHIGDARQTIYKAQHPDS